MSESGAGMELREILHNRSELLHAVADQPYTKPELIDIIGKTRSTIDRGVEDLKSVDCIERCDGEYSATTKGKLALEEHTDYSRVTNSLGTAGEILNHLPAESSINREFLKDVTVHPADPHVSGAALEASNELLQDATRMVGLAPTALTSYLNILEDTIQERNLTVEIVVEEVVLKSLLDVKGDEVTSLAVHDDISFYTFSDSLPNALWVMIHDDDAYAGITVYENGGVQGVLVNNSAEAVAWAKAVYQEYRDRASPTDVSSLP